MSGICRTLANHYKKERSVVGQLGLYPRYSLYVKPLAHYMCLMGIMHVNMTAIDGKRVVSADDRKFYIIIFLHFIYTFYLGIYFCLQ